MKDKNCYYCKHGKFIQGDMGDYWTPPEPSYTECLNMSVDENLFDTVDNDEEKLPLICGQFEPRIAENCICCKKEMNILESQVTHFFEENPCCSKDCQDKLYKGFYGHTIVLAEEEDVNVI